MTKLIETKVIAKTDRLIIRQFCLEDAAFILRLLNEESFIRYCSDRQVRGLEDAKRYLLNGPVWSYQSYGFGLNLVQLKQSKEPIGLCGLLKRAELDCPDLGYAFLPDRCGYGYACEAAHAVLEVEMANYALSKVMAVSMTDNLRSHQLLIKLGFSQQGTMDLHGIDNYFYQLYPSYLKRQGC